jgi:transmembrane sensor
MDFKIIERYFKGKASPDEIKQVLDFFKEKDLNPANEEMLRFWWDHFQYENGLKRSADKILNRIHNQMGTQVNRKKPAKLTWLGIAASIILMVSLTFILYNNRPIEPRSGQEFAQMVTKQTPVGVKLKFELPDGSMVNLNSNSKLIYPAEFDQYGRKVILQGEAYFDVTRNPDRSFIVECNSLTTTVLGTSFNISSYSEEVVVSVTSGKVKVDIAHNDSQSIYLTPGEQVKWDTLQQSVQVQPFNLYSTIAWKEGIIIFNESGLTEIVETLQRWYAVDIQVVGVLDNNNSEKWRYSGEFDNESLRNVLNGIAYVKGFDFEISGKKVTIKL